MAEKVTPQIDPHDGTMTCVRCSSELGKCVDGAYLLLGGARLYAHDKVPVKFFCDRCGKVFRWYEKPIADSDSFSDVTYEVLNALAFDQKYFRDEEENT